MTSDSTRWPLLEERGPFATASGRPRRHKLPRPMWLLAGLAFLCGGLVSAAVFSIGWRHQAQRDTAAQSALAAATARTHRLEEKVAALQTSLTSARGTTARARAAEQALARAGARVGSDATGTSGTADAIASGADTVASAATRIASELKTLDTYLTTTPAGQLDPGYISSQTAYLAQQLTRLEGNSGSLSNPVASFEAAVRKLDRDAKALKTG
jgi:hypothetical protein